MSNHRFPESLAGKDICRVVPFDPVNDLLISLDLSTSNHSLSTEIFSDTSRFSEFINAHIEKSGASFAIGGYDELRDVYARSEVFETPGGQEPRRLHLGTDIWGPAGTVISAPLPAVVHSFANNSNYGDYGGTIILEHNVEGFTFYTLYGHLSSSSLVFLSPRKTIAKGEAIGTFGVPKENGHWPPHLHFQIILDIGNYSGDYPGVCASSEKQKWLANSPDPDAILRMNMYAR